MSELGPLAHVGVVCGDVRQAMDGLSGMGLRWSTVTEPMVRLEVDGRRQEFDVDYVTSAGGEPRVKLLSAKAGTLFEPAPTAYVHHLSYWVEDLVVTLERLLGLGWKVEARGLDEEGCLRYCYLLAPNGLRIELGCEANRAEFDRWAHTGNEKGT